jgi:hypothetical protein
MRVVDLLTGDGRSANGNTDSMFAQTGAYQLVSEQALLDDRGMEGLAISPGSAMTPLLLGADIDPVKIQTQFIFDAYPVSSLVEILISINAGIP